MISTNRECADLAVGYSRGSLRGCDSRPDVGAAEGTGRRTVTRVDERSK